MSNGTLPKSIDIYKYIDQMRSLKGRIALSDCDQLAERVIDLNGYAEVVLEFGRDEQRQAIIQGQVTATLATTCERCGERVDQEVHSEWTSGVVSDDEQAKQLTSLYEPWVAESETFCIADFIGEELLLSLPMYTYHDDCGQSLRYTTESERDTLEPKQKENPFQVLAALKGGDRD